MGLPGSSRAGAMLDPGTAVGRSLANPRDSEQEIREIREQTREQRPDEPAGDRGFRGLDTPFTRS